MFFLAGAIAGLVIGRRAALLLVLRIMSAGTILCIAVPTMPLLVTGRCPPDVLFGCAAPWTGGAPAPSLFLVFLTHFVSDGLAAGWTHRPGLLADTSFIQRGILVHREAPRPPS